MSHGEDLRQASGDEALAQAVIDDPMTAPLNDADRALVDFAERLTLRPKEVSEADLERLRGQGFDDRAIHDAVQVIALFAYYNRMAEGLGVAIEDDPTP